MGKSSINGGFFIAMFDYWRAYGGFMGFPKSWGYPNSWMGELMDHPTPWMI